MTNTETIFVALLDEGLNVWRPVEAERLADGTYRLRPADDYDPDEETWEFPPGSRVVCVRRTLSQGDALVAVSLADAQVRTA